MQLVHACQLAHGAKVMSDTHLCLMYVSVICSGAVQALDAPDSWGFAEDGAPPSLRVFMKALNERLINAMQETVSNVSGIFLQVGLNATVLVV